MLGSFFYNETIRKTVVAFGTLFNNINVQKIDSKNKKIISLEKVPLTYGPKNKFLVRLDENPNLESSVAITLPRMYFEMTSINYDSSRKTSMIQQYKSLNIDNQRVSVQYTAVPYNMQFELGIMVKSSDTGLQILEQILPYFQPNFNVTINMIPTMNEKKDVAIILNDISYEDDWTDNFMQKRSVIWSLSFTAKSYIYGPVNSSGIIRKATVIEKIGSLTQPKNVAQYQVTPKALIDKNNDGNVNLADDLLLTADDDFGFNEGITLL